MGERVKKRTLFILFICLTLIYALIVLLGPADSTTYLKYHLTQSKSYFLSLSTIIPLALVWYSAYYGFSVFRDYARVIRKTAEGQAFDQIARGLGFLAFSLPLNSVIASLVNLLTVQHPSFFIPLTISKNYLLLILPLCAFVTISRGAEKLTLLVKRNKIRGYSPGIWALGIILLSSIFSWLIIARPADGGDPMNVYHLPNWLIIISIATPYLYTWFRGVLAAYYTSSYQHNVKGRLYRKSLRYLSAGILVVILVNILVQSMTMLSSRFYHLHLTPLLVVVYMLIALYAVGFGLLVLGAKRMRKIEEV